MNISEELKKVNYFKYLGAVVEENRGMEEDIG